MLKKFFTKETLVELDNILDNIVVLAECFIASEVLNTKSEIMKRYKENGEPLSLNIKEYSLVGEDVKRVGTIVDKEGREISKMELEFEDGRVKRYELTLKGKLKGKKIAITKYTTGNSYRKHCNMVDLVNTLGRMTKEVY